MNLHIPNIINNNAMFSFSGDQNHGSPMMQQSMRSQTPVMTPVPNNQGMPGQPPRMGGGPQGNVSALVVFFRCCISCI